MAKYYRFTYSAGYVGTDEEEIIEVPDNYTESEIENLYDDWYESRLTAYGGYEEISEEEALESGVDESYCD